LYVIDKLSHWFSSKDIFDDDDDDDDDDVVVMVRMTVKMMMIPRMIDC